MHEPVLTISKRLFHLCTFALLVASALANQQVVLGTQHEHSDPRLGAVASENKLCSEVGNDLLKAGGNAADAVSN